LAEKYSKQLKTWKSQAEYFAILSPSLYIFFLPPFLFRFRFL
jgi:hypothetical protein